MKFCQRRMNFLT